MRKSCTVIIALVLVSSLTSPSAGYVIDLYQPFDGLMTLLQDIKPIAPLKLLAGITKLLGCLGIPGNATLFAESEFLTGSQNFDKMGYGLPENFTELLKDYVQKPEFEEIHNFIWTDGTGTHWKDVIHFIYDSGFKEGDHNIYTWFMGIYIELEVPSKLIDTLPTGPPTPGSQKSSGYKTKSMPASQSSPSSYNLWSSLISFFQEQPTLCTEEQWMDIVKDIVESQGIQWLEVVRFVIREINGNPSMHAAWAKITETEKGKSFRSFINIDALTKLIDHWDKELKANDLFELIISILEGLTGVNFDELNINVVANTISIVEFLVWGTPFPRPPVTPSPMLGF